MNQENGLYDFEQLQRKYQHESHMVLAIEGDFEEQEKAELFEEVQFDIQKAKKLEKKEESLNQHIPLPDIAVPTSEMLKINNPLSQKTYDKYGPFDYGGQSFSDNTFSECITLGPYQFDNQGAVYVGQWKDG